MFGEQAGLEYKLNDNTFFKGAVTLYSYSGNKNGADGSVAGYYSTNPLNLGAGTATAQENASPASFDGPFVGAAAAPFTNVTGINDLTVLEVPMEFDFKAWNIPMRVFSDFAYNFQADARADAARKAILTGDTAGITNPAPGPGTTNINAPTFQGVLNSGKGFLDQSACQIGLEAGQLKKKGDWDAKAFYQSTGYYAVDPNLIDADIFNAAPNMQGAVVSVAYNWTDGVTSTLRYSHGVPVNDKLATPNVNQDIQTSDMKTYDLFQCDLMWKF
jgi:hypothetical protein